MANLVNIARPYALGAFEYAHTKEALPAWKTFLENASLLANQKEVLKLIQNPEIASAKLGEFFQEILVAGQNIGPNAGRKNFLLLLARNKRLNLLPQISQHFNAYYAALEKISKVRVVTAVTTQEDFRKKLVDALTKRMRRQVTLECEVDSSVIGGAIIHIGDWVIDGSIRGKLTRLFESLTA